MPLFKACGARTLFNMDSTRQRIETQIRLRRSLPPPEQRAALRKAAGLTLQEVADAVGVTAAAVWYWEQGQRTPGVKHLGAYLVALKALGEAATKAA